MLNPPVPNLLRIPRRKVSYSSRVIYLPGTAVGLQWLPVSYLVQAVSAQPTVQGDPDLETFQSLYFHSRESTLSDLAPSLAICLCVYISICTPPPPISPLYHTVLKTGGKVNIKTNEYSPLKKG